MWGPLILILDGQKVKIFYALLNHSFLIPNSVLGMNVSFAIAMFLSTILRVFLIVSVWRCAKNVSRKIYSYLSKITVLLLAVLTLYSLVNNTLNVINKSTYLTSLEKHSEE